jgi:enoyl-CoA hydratase/carnithine racemase
VPTGNQVGREGTLSSGPTDGPRTGPLRYGRGMHTLLISRVDQVVTVTLNRPEKKNAANGEMWDELLTTFRQLRNDPDARCVVITGSGDAFCSGADLSGTAGGDRPHQLTAMRHIRDVALSLHDLPMPTIAKVNGVAAGAGCNIALGCDLIVASDRARFSEIFARRGLSVDFGGTWLLPRLIGLHKAKELAFFADIIDAARAAELGLVNKVVPHDGLDAAVHEWATTLAAGAPIAISQTKTMLNRSIGLTMDECLELEGWAQTVNFGTSDTNEAISAFLQKRSPRFAGR